MHCLKDAFEILWVESLQLSIKMISSSAICRIIFLKIDANNKVMIISIAEEDLAHTCVMSGVSVVILVPPRHRCQPRRKGKPPLPPAYGQHLCFLSCMHVGKKSRQGIIIILSHSKNCQCTWWNYQACLCAIYCGYAALKAVVPQVQLLQTETAIPKLTSSYCSNRVRLRLHLHMHTWRCCW